MARLSRVPIHPAGNPALEIFFGTPAELALELCGVDGIAAVGGRGGRRQR